MAKVDRQNLPREVATNRGKLPGFQYAAEMPPGKQRWEQQPPEAFEKPRRRRSVAETGEVHTLRDALDLFRAKVPSRKLMDVKLDGARVGVLFVKEPSNDRYLVLFKREPYYHFSKHFPDIPSELKGFGIIANLKLVYWCALEGIKIVTVLKNARGYWIEGWDFYSFYETYDTECTFITDTTEIASPMRLWKRMF